MADVKSKLSAAVSGDFASSSGTPIVCNQISGEIAVMKADNSVFIIGSDKAKLVGDSTQVFEVATAITNTQAVPKLQMDTAISAAVSSSATATEKLPAGTCTQAGGALTFVMPACIYDFRDTTLTSGAVTQVSGTPANLVAPSGATIGFTSGVSGQLYRALINNAGTMEQAIINPVGWVDMPEQGVISTTAIGTGSDSAGVWYSTTARTGVAYKLVGKVEAVNTAGAWGSPTLVQGSAGLALTGMPIMRLLASIPTASGTAHDVTGIPSWVKRITVMLTGVSTSGTSFPQVQLGAGSIETTGYISESSFTAATTSAGSSTTGFHSNSSGAGINRTGAYQIIKVSELAWNATHNLGDPAVGTFQGGGSKTLTGTLDRIRLTTVNGTDTFDAGSFNLLLEGY